MRNRAVEDLFANGGLIKYANVELRSSKVSTTERQLTGKPVG